MIRETNTQTFYTAPKSTMPSLAHYAPGPTWGNQTLTQ